MAFDKAAYDLKYGKDHLVKKLVSFNRDKPEDMKLKEYAEAKGNFTAYVKELIRRDMESGK